jgi:UDP-N-acetylglucosamine 1-carboxyvinyltransferase
MFKGVEKLHGATVSSVDLRGGAALVIAGLVAEGTTEIVNISTIERGYLDIVGKLKELGADISKVYIDENAFI